MWKKLASVFTMICILLSSFFIFTVSAATLTNSQIEGAISWAYARKNAGDTSYSYYCLKFVGDAWSSQKVGNKGYSYATLAGNDMIKHTDKNPPRGAVVFWDWYGTVDGVYKNWGHVGIALGNGSVIHADYNGIRVTGLDIDSSRKYRGWGGWGGNDLPSDPLGNPVNVGNEFYSYIVKYDSWKLVTYDTACNVFLQSNYGNPNQVWHFQRQSDGSYKITNLYDNTALEVQYEDKKSGANIATHEWWGGDCQKWYIYGTPGKYKLRAKHTEYVMDVTSNSNEDGTNIVTYKFNDTGAQNFHLNWVDVKPATLNAEVGTSSKETVFTWSGATFASIYDLKIWNGTYWVGDPYHIQWGAEGGVLRILLPAGHYEAYIDTRHGKTIEMSNVVSFDVACAAPVGAVISMDKTYYALGDTINMYFSYIDADSVSIGIKKDGIAFAQPDVTGKSDYSFIAESTGVYTAYLSAWNPAGYIDSKTITFTVFDNSVPINMKSNISVQGDYYDVNTEIENLFCPAVYSVASYDSFGRPLDIKAKNISAGTIDVVLALPWKKNSAYIKVYLWDSLGNMQPLCEPVIVD